MPRGKRREMIIPKRETLETSFDEPRYIIEERKATGHTEII
jgi:hypothetical protein